MTRPSIVATAALLALFGASAAQAALHDRGNGLIYDDVLNLTWLQNANLAATDKFGVTTGIYGDGTMSGVAAANWIDAMNGVGYKGYDDWRLPTAAPVNGVAYQLAYAADGSTDNGANITSIGNELAYLFFVELGNQSLFRTDGSVRPGTLGVDFGVSNAGLFANLAGWPSAYGDFLTGSAVPGMANSAFYFNVSGGTQSYRSLSYDSYHAWAVRTGDVAAAPVPEPETWALMAFGLALTAMARRRRLAGAAQAG